MAGVRGDIGITINLTQFGTAELGTPKLPVAIEELFTLAAGTDATNKADVLWQDSGRSIAASGNENIDLSGALTDAFGASVVAAEIVLLFIKARATNTNNVQITRPASNGFAGPFLAAGDGIVLRPGECVPFISQAGWAVTASTGDLLNIANSGAGTAVLYDILVVGRTVAA